MRPLVGPNIQDLKPYVPGMPAETLRRERGFDGPILKLASNENPLGPSPVAIAAAQQALTDAHLYPDGAAFALRGALAKHMGVKRSQVVVGNGSNELINLLSRTFATPEDHAIISAHSFVAYRICLKVANVPTSVVPVEAPLKADLGAMLDAVGPKTRLIFLANPNNPTCSFTSRADLEALLDKLAALPDPPVFVLDEAYFEYVDAPDYPDAMALAARYPRLVIMRTFSKCYGMASFRVGYLVASEEIAGHLHRVREPFNTNRIAQIAATAALTDVDFVRRSVSLNAIERVRLREALMALGAEIPASQTNFLLCKWSRPAPTIHDALLDRGIIVRPVPGYGLPDHLRITVGTEAQNDRLIEAIRGVVAQ